MLLGMLSLQGARIDLSFRQTSDLCWGLMQRRREGGAKGVGCEKDLDARKSQMRKVDRKQKFLETFVFLLLA